MQMSYSYLPFKNFCKLAKQVETIKNRFWLRLSIVWETRKLTLYQSGVKCLCFVLLFIRKLCLVLSGSCHLLLEIKHFRCSFSLQLCGGSRPWTKGGGEKGGFVFVAQPAFLLLVISSFFKSGEAQDTGPSPRFDIGAISEIEQNLPPSINFANSPWPETFF